MAESRPISIGVVYAASAYIAWGIIPVFWKLLESVEAVEIVAHRIIWSMLFALAVTHAWERTPQLWAALKSRRAVGALLVSSAMIGLNWGLFIWAVTNDRILETSLGYYINPLVSFVLSVVFLKEKLSNIQLAAIVLAILGVVNQTVSLGYLPWISLVLAFSFGFYGLIRKTIDVEALEGLTIEAMILAPVSFAYVAMLAFSKQGAFMHQSATIDLWLIAAGPLTAIPLLLFSAGARLVKLSTMGFLQYLAPSISLLLAIVIYHEPFTRTHGITFGLIWCALLLVSWEALVRDRYSAAKR